MRTFLIATLLLGLGACGGGGGLEGELTGWKDKMCKCADKACADKTMEEYNAWAKGKRDEAKKLSADKLEKIGAIDKELKACRRKLREGDGADKAMDKPADKPAEGADKPADKPAEGAAKPADK